MEFLTVKDAAQELNVSEQMLRYYIRSKRINFIKHGRKYVIERGDLNKALKTGY